MKKTTAYIVAIFTLITCASTALHAQYKVKGTIYDSSRIYRIGAVTVMSTSGRITQSDSLGHYEIPVAEKDSIWFSFLGKPTPKYAVLKMPDVSQFDISLQLKSVVMEEVKVKNRSYRMDSIQNRKDYAKVFDYKKVSLGSLTSIGPTGAGVDLDELIRLFQFRKNKNMLKFQQRLIDQEKDKFIDFKFNKALVRRLTELDGDRLDLFMIRFRPSYEFVTRVSDYDFQLYIKASGELFKKSF